MLNQLINLLNKIFSAYAQAGKLTYIGLHITQQGNVSFQFLSVGHFYRRSNRIIASAIESNFNRFDTTVSRSATNRKHYRISTTRPSIRIERTRSSRDLVGTITGAISQDNLNNRFGTCYSKCICAIATDSRTGSIILRSIAIRSLVKYYSKVSTCVGLNSLLVFITLRREINGLSISRSRSITTRSITARGVTTSLLDNCYGTASSKLRSGVELSQLTGNSNFVTYFRCILCTGDRTLVSLKHIATIRSICHPEAHVALRCIVSKSNFGYITLDRIRLTTVVEFVVSRNGESSCSSLSTVGRIGYFRSVAARSIAARGLTSTFAIESNFNRFDTTVSRSATNRKHYRISATRPCIRSERTRSSRDLVGTITGAIRQNDLGDSTFASYSKRIRTIATDSRTGSVILRSIAIRSFVKCDSKVSTRIRLNGLLVFITLRREINGFYSCHHTSCEKNRSQ